MPARMCFHQEALIAPDRLRSFLKYLQNRQSPLRVCGLPATLYSVSEQLARAGGALQLKYIADHQQEQDLVLQAAGSEVSLDFGASLHATRLLASAALLDLLVAGGRILAADYAVMEGIAVWVSAGFPVRAEHVAGMEMLEEQSDGAQLWLRRGIPATSAEQQAICALLLDSHADRDLLLEALERALRAPDWKVRVCAMIGATRHRLIGLRLAVERMDVPETHVPGVTGELRHLLLAMRKAAVILLSDTTLPAVELVAPDTRTGMQAHLLRLMAGEPPVFQDEFALLIDSLLHPGEK